MLDAEWKSELLFERISTRISAYDSETGLHTVALDYWVVIRYWNALCMMPTVLRSWLSRYVSMALPLTCLDLSLIQRHSIAIGRAVPSI